MKLYIDLDPWARLAWNGLSTPYYALGYDDVSAAKFYGLILFEVMLQRPETWGFGRYAKDGRPLKEMTYFRLPKWQES